MARKVCIRILQDRFDASAEDSVLRALQEYGIARKLPDYGFTRFCWNASCEQCVLTFDCGEGPQVGFACQTQVREGMHVQTLPTVLYWKKIPTGS